MNQPSSRELPELTIDGQQYLQCECGDLYPAKSYGAGFMVANDGVCENCDAEQVAIPGPVVRNLLGELYQVLGALSAGGKVLDQVSAAIQGQPLPHVTLLPYCAGDPDFNFEDPPRGGLLNGISVMDGGPVLPERTVVASHDVFLMLREKEAKQADEGAAQ